MSRFTDRNSPQKDAGMSYINFTLFFPYYLFLTILQVCCFICTYTRQSVQHLHFGLTLSRARLVQHIHLHLIICRTHIQIMLMRIFKTLLFFPHFGVKLLFHIGTGFPLKIPAPRSVFLPLRPGVGVFRRTVFKRTVFPRFYRICITVRCGHINRLACLCNQIRHRMSCFIIDTVYIFQSRICDFLHIFRDLDTRSKGSVFLPQLKSYILPQIPDRILR